MADQKIPGIIVSIPGSISLRTSLHAAVTRLLRFISFNSVDELCPAILRQFIEDDAGSKIST